MAFLMFGWLMAVLLIGATVVAAPAAEAKGKGSGSGKPDRILTTLKGSPDFPGAKGKAKFQGSVTTAPATAAQSKPGSGKGGSDDNSGKHGGKRNDDCQSPPCTENEQE